MTPGVIYCLVIGVAPTTSCGHAGLGPSWSTSTIITLILLGISLIALAIAFSSNP
jgi:hypothetical protein